jgi:dolichol-phosphate mannosyltransferase
MSDQAMKVLPFHLPARLAWAEPWLLRLYRWRYVRFATVGASGTLVNMAVLFVLQEWVLAGVLDPAQRLSIALACAIAVATLNNFAWNSLWTWADRLASGLQTRLGLNRSTLWRLLKYALASWFGILIQYALTLWLSGHMHYLLANVISIVVASVSNYLTNDWWTFRRHQPPEA